MFQIRVSKLSSVLVLWVVRTLSLHQTFTFRNNVRVNERGGKFAFDFQLAPFKPWSYVFYPYRTWLYLLLKDAFKSKSNGTLLHTRRPFIDYGTTANVPLFGVTRVKYWNQMGKSEKCRFCFAPKSCELLFMKKLCSNKAIVLTLGSGNL